MKVAAFIISILTLLISGFMFQCMWSWFIVPFGVIGITFWHGIGFSLIATYLTTRTDELTKELTSTESLNRIVNVLVFTVLVFVYAWACHFGV